MMENHTSSSEPKQGETDPNTGQCDFSLVKIEIKQQLKSLSQRMNQVAEALEEENQCIISEIADIRKRFLQTESITSAFYLQCYLSPFTNVYIDLSLSIQRLSERRHGALIVMQRESSIDSLMQNGVPIQATFSCPLLESIFYPGNPLHDGATLIIGQQIVSAAHILPLSHRKVDNMKLGTRHRAALGLTEQSDALVIVVSEETGKSSFAINGKLYPFNPQSIPV